MVCKLACKGVRKSTDTHLETVAVLYEGSTVLSDQLLDVRRLNEASCNERCVVLDEIVELIEWDEVSEGKWDVRIHYSDYDISRLDCGIRAVH